MSDASLIAPWLTRLGTLCVTNQSDDQFMRTVQQFVLMLDGKYLPRMWSQANLETVASRSKFFPSYGELCEHMDEIANRPWREKSTAAAQLPAPQTEPKRDATPAELEAVRLLVKSWTDEVAKRHENEREERQTRIPNRAISPQHLAILREQNELIQRSIREAKLSRDTELGSA